VTTDEASSSDSELDDFGDTVLTFLDTNNNNSNKTTADENLTPPPELIIKENVDYSKDTYCFPDVYNLLQCFTLKNAGEDYDLERYEILGDCFLKLTVVIQIYMDFFNTQEGKMVKLKSMRVSNHYLYDLAIKKKLDEFIVGENYIRERHVFPCNTKRVTRTGLKLSDKSFADCVEALIGCYLINLGAEAANLFIEWLDFVISDKMGNACFNRSRQLPDPLITKDLHNRLQTKIANWYDEFEKDVIGYKFKNRVYLYQAFSHPSDMNNVFSSSYQRFIIRIIWAPKIDVFYLYL
jgi:dsRNA-specific ribonuclease